MTMSLPATPRLRLPRRADDYYRAPAPIIAKDLSFSGLEVKAGARLVVQNEGPAADTFTSEDNRFDTGTIAAGSNAQITVPSVAGVYKDKGTIHPTADDG